MTQNIPQIFADDEMSLLSIDPNCSPEELLEIPGIFYLKDICKKLDLKPYKLKQSAKEIEDSGSSAWEIMGIRKTWSHWIVRMRTFAPYYHEHLLPPLDRVEKEWDANTMLSQKGTFYLAKVCQKILFTPHNIKYEVRQTTNPAKKIGVWKDEEYKTYLVDMAIFSRYMHNAWSEGNPYPRGKEKVIFKTDEMVLKQVYSDWDDEQLLSQNGVFPLKPVAKILDVDPADLRKASKSIKADGRSPWDEIGVRKSLSQWFIHMGRFAPYYRNNKAFKIEKVDPAWDGNELLTKTGLFNLTKVCKKLPFSAHQFRHQIRSEPNAREAFGAWWDEDLKHYIVDMEVFSKWVIELWTKKKGGFA